MQLVAYALTRDQKCFENDLHTVTGHWIYLHGQIEEINRFDLVCMDYQPTYDGIFPIDVILIDGTKYECTLYLWDVNAGANHQHGLIVLNDDTEAKIFAKQRYDEKRKTL